MVFVLYSSSVQGILHYIYCTVLIFQVFNRLKQDECLSCHFVEISPELSHLQAQRLCSRFEKNDDKTKLFYMNGVTKHNVPVYWYYSVQDVPKCFTCLVAHEFFDALPIHKLQVILFFLLSICIMFKDNLG